MRYLDAISLYFAKPHYKLNNTFTGAQEAAAKSAIASRLAGIAFADAAKIANAAAEAWKQADKEAVRLEKAARAAEKAQIKEGQAAAKHRAQRELEAERQRRSRYHGTREGVHHAYNRQPSDRPDA